MFSLQNVDVILKQMITSFWNFVTIICMVCDTYKLNLMKIPLLSIELRILIVKHRQVGENNAL